MKIIKMIAVGLMLQTAVSSAVLAAETGTKDEAISLTKKAVSFHKANGNSKAFAEINNKTGQFVDRDLYVYVLDTTGHVRAHGANEKLIDKDLIQLKDADGKPFITDIIKLVKTNKAGWVDYKWVNPISKKIESKSTYVEPVGDLGFAVGVYK